MADTNNSYDMQHLQQEAIRRAREMQARAQNAAASPIPPPTPRSAPARTPAPGSIPVRHTPEPSGAHADPPRPAEDRFQAGTKDFPNPRSSSNSGDEKNSGDFNLLGMLPGPVNDIFDSLLADRERTLILVLLLILVEEKADSGVIMAMMYLVL